MYSLIENKKRTIQVVIPLFLAIILFSDMTCDIMMTSQGLTCVIGVTLMDIVKNCMLSKKCCVIDE